MTKAITSSVWKDETEKKYRLPSKGESTAVRQRLEAAHCLLLHDVFQRDWVSDFEDGELVKKATAGVRLRFGVERGKQPVRP